VKQVPPTSRGAAVGAYATFFDVGIARGALAGFIAGRCSYPAAFAASAIGTVLATCRYAHAGAAATSSTSWFQAKTPATWPPRG
jgi:hypothetical protein